MTRHALGLIGMLLAVTGLVLDSRYLVWAAIGVLGVSFVWRLVAARRSRVAAAEARDAGN